MKKITILFFIFIDLSNSLLGQNPLVKQWDRRYGGQFKDELAIIQQTIDGGYILGGSSFSDSSGDKSQTTFGDYDYWIIKVDSLGNKEWDKDFGGIQEDRLFALQQTVDGGYIIGGHSYSGISGNKSQVNWNIPGIASDYWIVKIDSLGNKQWDKDFGGTNFDYLRSLHQTTDNGFILGGYTFSDSSGDKTQARWGYYDYWIVKTDSLGNKQWDKDFGGTASDIFSSIQQTSDGGFILGGYSVSGISGNKTQGVWGNWDYWIVKIDSLGNKQWDKDFGGGTIDYFFNLQQTFDGGFILGGYSRSGVGGSKTQPTKGFFDYWIIKIDSIGNQEWDKDFGGSDEEEDFGNVMQTADNGYLIAGTSYSSISGDKTENNLTSEQSWIIKTDSIGNKQWDKTLHTNSPFDDETGLAIQTKDGSYVLANYTYAGIGGDKTDSSRGQYDYWIIKYCDTTSIIITPPLAFFISSDTSFCGKQCIDFTDISTNNPTSWQWYFPGADSTSSNMQNPTGICYSSYGSFDVTLIACNGSGCDTLIVSNFINEFQNPAIPVVSLSNDTLFSTPAFSYQWYLNSSPIAGATSQYYVFQQMGTYFVIVTDSNGCASSSSSLVLTTGINESNDDHTISLIPNPSDGNFILSGAPINSTIKIYDLDGRIIYSDIVNSPEMHLQLRADDGIYFIELLSNNKSARKKIVIKN